MSWGFLKLASEHDEASHTAAMHILRMTNKTLRETFRCAQRKARSGPGDCLFGCPSKQNRSLRRRCWWWSLPYLYLGHLRALLRLELFLRSESRLIRSILRVSSVGTLRQKFRCSDQNIGLVRFCFRILSTWLYFVPVPRTTHLIVNDPFVVNASSGFIQWLSILSRRVHECCVISILWTPRCQLLRLSYLVEDTM